MGNRKQKLQKMKNEQFEKLTQNEAGQLKGGFRSLTAKIRTNILKTIQIASLEELVVLETTIPIAVHAVVVALLSLKNQ